jgi:uncharacterized surface protein with fasciclin (FAS1) repeats
MPTERTTAMKLLSISILAACTLLLAPSAAPATARTHQNLVRTAVAAGQFKTLVMLLQHAGLAATLEKPGPYTVFAPTDAAFKQVPKQTLNALLRDKAKLRSVLLYHVVSGRVTAAAAAKLSSAKTLDGVPVRIHIKGPSVYVNTAKVVTPDVKATNGVIHVINRVLLPPAR